MSLPVHPLIYRDEHEPRDKEFFLWLHHNKDKARVLEEYNGDFWEVIFKGAVEQAAVLYDREQELTDEEKETARHNIDAISERDFRLMFPTMKIEDNMHLMLRGVSDFIAEDFELSEGGHLMFKYNR